MDTSPLPPPSSVGTVILVVSYVISAVVAWVFEPGLPSVLVTLLAGTGIALAIHARHLESAEYHTTHRGYETAPES